jgi:DNA-binding transcriptional MerR regulator
VNKSNQLLSIGKLSKLTGASVRSLRYYEKLGILAPAHISPDSSYRYYSREQIWIVEIIMLCIELNIPLNELTKVDDPIAFQAFLKHGRETAEQKLEALERGLKLMETIEQEMGLTDFAQN